MGIRETLNNNPAITTGATIAIIVVAIGFILYSSLGGGGMKPPTEAFYTTDDGKTWFADDINKMAPFKTSDGKEAVRAHVFSCKDGKDPFVSYLERMTPDAQKKLEAVMAKPEAERDMMAVEEIHQTGVEVKKPGDQRWTRMSDYQRYSDITSVNCPDGNNKDLMPVFP